MMRSSAVALVGLLFVATGLVTAALFTHSSSARYLALGLLLGQIVIASAAVVLVRDMLPLRLMFLGIVLFYATTWICLTSYLDPLQVALPLIGAALVAAAWCAALQLFGWRVVGIGRDVTCRDGEGDAQRSGQFSLATILLITTIVAVYLGLLRASGLTWANGLEFLMVCLLSVLPGCLLLRATARARWAWLPCVIVIPLLYLCLGGLDGRVLPHDFVAMATRALTAELAFVGTVLAVLRVAGICLARAHRASRHGSAGVRAEHHSPIAFLLRRM